MQRWGILGTSFILDTVAQTIVDHPECHLQAVAGRRQSAVLEFAEQYKIEATYTDYEQLINDVNIDVVYIGLPNHLHHQYTQLALAANKDVLCEKSLSVDMLKTDEIVTAVKASDHCFLEGLMYVHHPYFKALISWLKSGELGKITQISASYCVDIAQFVNAEGGWCYL